MTLTVLFAASNEDWHKYGRALSDAFTQEGLDAELVTRASPQDVDYIVYAPTSTLQDFSPYKNTKAVLSLWAGVERIVTNDTLTFPLIKMVDPGMTQSMVEWVVGHVMRYHLGMDSHIVNPQREWEWHSNPLAQERRVCILGLGSLGTAVGEQLCRMNFRVSGWSRSAKNLDGIETFHGSDGLRDALATGEILVLLLPDTAETENTLNRETLAQLPKGAYILNPGRGPLIEDAALIEALDSGQVAHATLDVFRTEPLPQDHPFWAHPNVTVTPHIAAATRPVTSAKEIARNIVRGEKGEAFLNLVDRARGY
ncbi:glyoxylate/hydroxypyruvate reductase A [Roseobacter denitrificans]|uniref:2-hydroxyacid dehydrogenase, putative n=1 Tax=Roseobacter denitrificans (strain ATCC 33942 / OCh 114) TaxID=375451 RepID=Q16AZ0_ROSDO|nr:glyoxylate/hydroxypyruvate reductase A [Roseobacter denitrificans]ABG30853.1 2-hydroxyacid dehydrogenase, putative [Roseobacter denitrificans OCh 114]AVL53955.1 glyoxylate/hydroxypyruvate reductase A [Roseobacter denitrificans]SFG15209.1 glyoxylate/hydroxypyruvate reductase A [Roseobacter denitrificans OCh 114]